jgi:hypothetical protein
MANNGAARVAKPTFAQESKQKLPKNLTETKRGASLEADVRGGGRAWTPSIQGRGRFVLRRVSSAAAAVEAREQVQADMPGFEHAATFGNVLTSSARESGALPASKGTLSFVVF